jgi:BlaI family penicillinase repressor
MSKKSAKKSCGEKPPVTITEAEWAVMELLWEHAPRTSQEIAAHLEKERGWKRATVLTLLTRLATKGAVSTEPQGNRFLYTPAVQRSACVADETRTFLERMFGGALQPLVAHLAEQESLTKQDIVELKALLNEIKPKA